MLGILGLNLLPAAGAGQADAVARLRGRFRSDGPAVSASCNLAYRFLFLNIKRLARATVEATQGRWQDHQTGAWLPAVLLEFRLDSLDKREEVRRGQISLHNRMISILKAPGLETLVYAKEADEFVNPLFNAKSRARYLEVYNFESGDLP